MARQHPEEPTLVELTIEEVKAMGKQGIDHPSTRPVITGGVVGAIAGAVLPVVHMYDRFADLRDAVRGRWV